MTIRLLAQYQGNPPNTIVTLAGGVETALVAAGNATTDLSGGVPPAFTAAPPVQIGDVLYGADGVPLGIADPTGKLISAFSGITVPGAPSGVTLTPIAGGVLAAFTPSATLGGTATTGFEVTLSNGRVQRGAASPVFINSPAGAVTATVKQINGAGLSAASAASASATVTAYSAPAVPGAPTSLTLTAGNGKVTATWTAAAANGSPLRNTIVTLSNGATATAAAGTTSVDIATPNGIAVTATARANNGEGPGPVSAVSNSVTPTTAPVLANTLFTRQATGFAYQGELFTNGGNLTSYDSMVAHRAMHSRETVHVLTTNVYHPNGDTPELVSNTPLREYVTAEWLNDAGTAPVFTDALIDGAPFADLPANVATVKEAIISGVTWPTDRNILIKFRLTHPDGVSQIAVPRGTAGDYAASSLGTRGAEGQVFNSATSLARVSGGGAAWAARQSGNQFRPLAVFASDGPAVRSAALITDSIGSHRSSWISQLCQVSGIPFNNLGSGGESQFNWPSANTATRALALAYASTVVIQVGVNGRGRTRTEQINQLRTLTAYIQTTFPNVKRVIWCTITPATSAAATNPNPGTVAGQNPDGSSYALVNADMMAAVGTTNGPGYVFNVRPAVATPDLTKFADNMSTDYLHLTNAGDTAALNLGLAENWAAQIL